MPIYSNNRLSSVVESVVAAPGYDMFDFGRVLYECEVNDRAIFEAVIVSDIAEATAIRSGAMTLQEAENESSNKKNQVLESMTKMLESFMSKIKAIFESVRNKLTELLVKNGKVFNTTYKQKIDKYFKDGGEKIKLSKEVKYISNAGLISSYVDKIVNGYKNDSFFAKLVTNGKGINIPGATSEVRSAVGRIDKDSIIDVDSVANSDDITEIIDEFTSTISEVGRSDVDKLIKSITSSADIISNITKIQRTCEKDIQSKIKFIKGYISKAESDQDEFTRIRSRLNAYQKAITAACRNIINAVLSIIKSTRAGLMEVYKKADGQINESSLVECAMCWLESDAEVDEVIKAPATEKTDETECPNGECDDSSSEDKDINIDIDSSDIDDSDKDDDDKPTEVNVNITIED